MDRPKETDWKLYTSLFNTIRERYLREKNIDFVNTLSDPKETATEQFWTTLEQMKVEVKVLDECFGKLNRSLMISQMKLMCQHHMIREDDLEGFSQGVLKEIKPFLNL